MNEQNRYTVRRAADGPDPDITVTASSFAVAAWSWAVIVRDRGEEPIGARVSVLGHLSRVTYEYEIVDGGEGQLEARAVYS